MQLPYLKTRNLFLNHVQWMRPNFERRTCLSKKLENKNLNVNTVHLHREPGQEENSSTESTDGSEVQFSSRASFMIAAAAQDVGGLRSKALKSFLSILKQIAEDIVKDGVKEWIKELVKGSLGDIIEFVSGFISNFLPGSKDSYEDIRPLVLQDINIALNKRAIDTMELKLIDYKRLMSEPGCQN